MQTEQYAFMYLGIYIYTSTCMYICVLIYIHIWKQSLNLTESKGVYMRVWKNWWEGGNGIIRISKDKIIF